MPFRNCVVSFTDGRGSRHTVEVSAETLFEAAVLGVTELRRCGFLEQPPGIGTRLEIEVRQPIVRHVVTIQQVKKWLNEWGTNPNEILRKRKLREQLGTPMTP